MQKRRATLTETARRKETPKRSSGTLSRANDAPQGKHSRTTLEISNTVPGSSQVVVDVAGSCASFALPSIRAVRIVPRELRGARMKTTDGDRTSLAVNSRTEIENIPHRRIHWRCLGRKLNVAGKEDAAGRSFFPLWNDQSSMCQTRLGLNRWSRQPAACWHKNGIDLARRLLPPFESLHATFELLDASEEIGDLT